MSANNFINNDELRRPRVGVSYSFSISSASRPRAANLSLSERFVRLTLIDAMRQAHGEQQASLSSVNRANLLSDGFRNKIS
jgi:hypothetical protein